MQVLDTESPGPDDAVMEVKVVIDGHDLDALAAFWSAALGYQVLDVWDPRYRNLRPASGGADGPALLLQQVPERKLGKNRLHLDLHPADGPATVDRMAALGASPVGSVNTDFFEAHGTSFQVLADPEGNEFCVVWRSRDAAWDLPSPEGV
jgi:predicted enzyme related to lactoylglutathione lyase